MKRPLVLTVAACLALAPLSMAYAEAPATALKQPKLELQQFTLQNGLRVVLVEQHHAPVISVCLTYDVGSRDEVKGRTGFAHLFEHMMFQGSENVGKAEHFVLISSYGGTMNGSTSFDRTNYFETLPANQLEMALFLEADRMKSLDVSQENLENQRQAVKEERRLRYDNRPYGTGFEQLIDLTYDNFAYKHSTIGSMADLDAATLDDVRSFFKKYYAPNNAWLVLVGDTTMEVARPLIEKHFGSIPSQVAPEVPDLTEKLNKGERRRDITDAKAPQVKLDMLYPTIRGDHPDFYALDLLAFILGGGESSRLYQKLVKETELATAAGAGSYQIRGPSPVMVFAMVAPGKDVAAVEKAIDQEIERLQSGLVTPEELNGAKASARAMTVESFDMTRSIAVEMGQLAAYYGRPELMNEQAARYQSVTAEDLQRVARTYLGKANRGVLTTRPAPAPEATPAKQQ